MIADIICIRIKTVAQMDNLFLVSPHQMYLSLIETVSSRPHKKNLSVDWTI